MNRARWEPCLKGVVNEPAGGAFEVAVVRASNTHGKLSYGWPGPDKTILITGDIHDWTLKCLKGELQELAEIYARSLNAKEDRRAAGRVKK